MNSPVKGCEFSTATSGTERKRGFVGIGAFLCEPLIKVFFCFLGFLYGFLGCVYGARIVNFR